MQTKPEDDPGTCTTGMPEVCRHPGGHYVTRGMKFHMNGDWLVRFDVTGPAGPDHAEVTIKE
jgi:hypothetical protein